MKVANCGHDENGKYRGGKAGDQTGHEWEIIDYYVPSYGWSYHFKWKDEELGKQFAELAKQSANNNNIGYCQDHRSTFEKQLKSSKWLPKDINVKCEADCSSGVIGLIHAIGYLNKITELKNFKATYTGNLYKYLKESTYFELTYDKHYLGEINLTPNHHINIIVDIDNKKINTNRKQFAQCYDKSLAGKYNKTCKDNLMIRDGAGSNYAICGKIQNGDQFICYGYYNILAGVKWLYGVNSKGVRGFTCSTYLRKVN